MKKIGLMKKGIIAIDLDGTLLNSNSELSDINRDALLQAQQNGFLVVIATGRSLFSAKKVLVKDLPIDYLIFSSGAGAVDWKTGELLFSNNIPISKTQNIIDVLKKNHLNFMVHKAVPDNHWFAYHNANDNYPDFTLRKEIYSDYVLNLPNDNWKKESCQFIVMFSDITEFYNIKEFFSDMKVIRTTSPLNGETIWMEIFPVNVSKATGVDFLRKKYDLKIENIVVIGNDFNDIDMLEYTENSYVVANAPEKLLEKYKNVESNNDNGVAKVIDMFI